MPTIKNGSSIQGHMGETCHGCQCGGRGWLFFLLRALITIFILMLVFWFGLAVGAISGAGWDRYYMMRGWGGAGGGVPMMGMMPVRGATSTPSSTGFPQNY